MRDQAKGELMLASLLPYPLAYLFDQLTGSSYLRIFSYAIILIVKGWSGDYVELFGGGFRVAGDPWLYVAVSRPADDKREGWMFTRETNNARPRCSFNLDDLSSFRFPRQ